MNHSSGSVQRVHLQDAAEVKWGDTQTTKAAYKPTGYLAYSASGPDGFMDHFDHEGPGIVLSAIGAQCGKTWYASGKWSCIKNTIYLKARPEVADTRFLFYATSAPDFWPKRGAAQPFISQGDARRCELHLPPLETQRRIASILGAYDDLVEINRQRVAVLEEMARGLFEEWFVQFRYPGYGEVPIADTPQGPLPEGWDFVPLREAAAYINRGIAPRYDEASSLLVIGQKCIRDQRVSLRLARRQSKKVPPDKLVQSGDILINSTGVGTLGRVGQIEDAPEGLTVDSHVTIVRPQIEADWDYLGLQALRLQSVFEHLGAGSTGQTELSRSAVEEQVVTWPSGALRHRFGTIVRPMRRLILELLRQSEALTTSRDLLLPRLISGQLSVMKAEGDLEKAA